MKKTNEPGKPSPKMTPRRLAALIGVALLVLLYIATLIIAVVDTSSSGKWFKVCLFATVAVPFFIWIYTWMYGKLTGRHTIADAGTIPDAEDNSAVPGTAPDAEGNSSVPGMTSGAEGNSASPGTEGSDSPGNTDTKE